MDVSFSRYLLGVLLGVITLAPLGAGAVALRAALLPQWRGAPARLAEAVIGFAALFGMLEILGLVSLYRLAGVAVAGPLVGGACVLAARRIRPQADTGAARAISVERIAVGALVVAVALVFGTWILGMWRAYLTGIYSPDSVWYHMPFAARWVQDHSTTGIPYTDVDWIDAFYPAGTEILHGLGIILFARDFLSPVINVVWLALGVLAGWCIGRPRGVAPAAAVGVALMFGIPLVATFQAGTANNDAAATTMLLCAVALVVNAGEARAPLVLAGIAAGLGIGIKLPLLVPAVVLMIALVFVEPAGRRRATAIWMWGGFIAAGVYWYARNLIAVGSPMPFVNLGPLKAASHPPNFTNVAVSHYLTNFDVIRHQFVHGLVTGLGRVWPLVLLVGIGGLIAVLAARGSTKRERAIAVAALISAVAYVFTPATAAGPPDQPVEFVLNLRYLLPALAVGAAMTPGALTAFRLPARTVGMWSAVGMLVVLAASEPIHTLHPSDHPSLPALGFVAILALFAGWMVLRTWRPSVVAAVALSALAAVVLVFGGFRAEHRYRNRYSTFLPLGQVVSTWAFNLRDARIGVVGTGVAENQYPLYGPDLSNRVRYIAQQKAHGTFATITSCRTFMNAVNHGRYGWLVVTPQIQLFTLNPLPSPESKWLARMRNAQLFKQDLQHQIYRVTGPMDPNACPASA